ncbi:orotate phosphoribosyltransferase [Aequitasia blattaphilus]|uniref:Phosphoribosyltransferase n=1 Tax=Aequitasia blattaphilus TaxID=2949332 RepID=A0ABT1E8I3_9FIRM|nr:phosphoribosyltransferase [Aequitasia blattaphilus]MCP1101181.1 phosphoribosyltransferase [Aequitasia blattaphilus]MCR8613821.1 phosphoribosyltransferase [Aequitasia blattaphilus]
MEIRLEDLYSPKNSKSKIKIMRGHFSSTHAHVNTYIDISTVTNRSKNAKETADLLAESYRYSTKVDTIVCLDGTRVIGAFLAENLSKEGMSSINGGENIAVVTPETVARGQQVFRDNTKRMIAEKDVLILSGTVITGETMLRTINTVLYYGGRVSGLAAVFSGISKVAGMDMVSVFALKDVPDYQAYSMHDCPMCKAGRKLDGIVNSYGYSLL